MKHPKYYCERCLKDKEPEELFAVGHKMLCAECERKAGPGLLALRKLDFANIRRGKYLNNPIFSWFIGALAVWTIVFALVYGSQ